MLFLKEALSIFSRQTDVCKQRKQKDHPGIKKKSVLKLTPLIRLHKSFLFEKDGVQTFQNPTFTFFFYKKNFSKPFSHHLFLYDFFLHISSLSSRFHLVLTALLIRPSPPPLHFPSILITSSHLSTTIYSPSFLDVRSWV